MSPPKIFETPLKVINIGLESFTRDLAEAEVEVVQVDWRPPSGGDPRLAALLAGLDDDD
jgi:FdrA protein